MKLKEGLEALGLDFFVEEQYRLPQLNAITLNEGLDDAALRTKLLRNYGIEIGGGLGVMTGKIWRIGLMGHSSRQENIDKLIGALKDTL